jgi:Flp pilus assembly protein TadG
VWYVLDQCEHDDLRASPGVIEKHWFLQRRLRLVCVVSIPIPVLAAFYVSEQAENLDHCVGTGANGEPVIRWPLLRNWIGGLVNAGWRDDGAALVEFAVSLPLLMVFVVGIFDFSNAFTLKQKFTNIARDAARAAAADPANDLQSTLPMSVTDAFQVVDSYLLANNINDCGITTGGTPSGLTWTFSVTATSGSPCGITLIINRGYYFPVTGAILPTVSCTSQPPGRSQTAIIGTCVSIQYNYSWRFGRVASLLGRTATLPSTISAAAVAMNEN